MMNAAVVALAVTLAANGSLALGAVALGAGLLATRAHRGRVWRWPR